jgi:hypothetical protein
MERIGRNDGGCEWKGEEVRLCLNVFHPSVVERDASTIPRSTGRSFVFCVFTFFLPVRRERGRFMGSNGMENGMEGRLFHEGQTGDATMKPKTQKLAGDGGLTMTMMMMSE